tara:strand:- start:51 stop:242 length:192 start_codon:yes stop_codon:yes gene_type:complete
MDINKVISIVRRLKEDAPTMSVGDGSGTALPPTHEPGVNKKKKKNIYLGMHSRKKWLDYINGK